MTLRLPTSNTVLTPAPHQSLVQKQEGRHENCAAACAAAAALPGEGSDTASSRPQSCWHNRQCCLTRGSSQAGSSPPCYQGKESHFFRRFHHTASQEACVWAWRLQVGLSVHITHWKGDILKREHSPGVCCVQQQAEGVPVQSPSAAQGAVTVGWPRVPFSMQAR